MSSCAHVLHQRQVGVVDGEIQVGPGVLGERRGGGARGAELQAQSERSHRFVSHHHVSPVSVRQPLTGALLTVEPF